MRKIVLNNLIFVFIKIIYKIEEVREKKDIVEEIGINSVVIEEKKGYYL